MKLLRKILFPFSLLYGGITALRNLMYDKGWLKSRFYNLPIICVGNLSTGGTGKSPMIEFLISFLKDNCKVAVLSRGYKRNTKGFQTVSKNSTAKEVGDEPLQFKSKFPEVLVAVCEDRQTGIEKLKESVEAILLDDAFQHRKVKASFNILLTTFDELYIDDCVLPTGNLREPKFGAKRANIIVVTKCPENLEINKMEEIKLRLKPSLKQEVFFTKIGYSSEIVSIGETKSLEYLRNKEFTLVTGIAKPKPLVSYLKENELTFKHNSFPDHHNFSEPEIGELKKNKIVLTTEKDYMRLQSKMGKTELYYLPIQTVFLNGEEGKFKKLIGEAVAILP